MITRLALTAALTICAGASQAYDSSTPFLTLAQGYDRPADYDAPPVERDAGAGPDTGALLTRIDRLERDLRKLTGQNEELQHKVQVLEEQLKAAKELAPPPAAETAARPAPAASPAPAAATNARRGDAFDPASDPSAPGAPKPLGSPASATPKTATGAVTTAAPREAGQPLDIAHGRLVGDTASAPGADGTPAPAAVPTGPKEEYDEAVSTLKAGRFEAAQKSLEAFLAKNPKSKYVPAATFNLGESYILRGRHREAAEKYLEITQKYGQSAQAPDALLRLGQSLGAMGAKDQACASFNEIGMKYPGSAARIREAAQRESKKLQC